MKHKEYIYRENSDPEILISPDEEFEFLSILEKDYDYLFESINDENYDITEDRCNLFSELVYQDKVVGFATFMIRNEFTYMLTNVFVMPEYRGCKLLRDMIFFYQKHDYDIEIYNPNDTIMDILTLYKLAEYLTLNIIVSALPLINKGSYYRTCTDGKLNDEEYYTSNIYDTKLSSTIYYDYTTDNNTYPDNIEDDGLSESESESIYCSKEAGSDNIDDEYICNLKEKLLTNKSIILHLQNVLKCMLPRQEYDIEELVGVYPELSENLEKLVSDGLNKNKAYDIQFRLTEELKSGLIVKESLMRRMVYLLKTNGKKEEFKNGNCLLCYMPIDITDPFCKVCGYNNQKGYTKLIKHQRKTFKVENKIKELVMKGVEKEEIEKIIKKMLEDNE